MAQMLARTFNPKTYCWEAPGLTPITAEVMDPLLQPRATMLDLLVVLAERDKSAATQAAPAAASTKESA